MATSISSTITREMEEVIDFSLLHASVTACVILTIAYKLRLISDTVQMIVRG